MIQRAAQVTVQAIDVAEETQVRQHDVDPEWDASAYEERCVPWPSLPCRPEGFSPVNHRGDSGEARLTKGGFIGRIRAKVEG
jgi:hypothetical protein